MEKLQLFLLILQVVIAVVMIILVLLQRSDGDSLSGISGGSGGLNNVISSKASANILSKATMILVAVFMVNCLILASMSNLNKKRISSELDQIIQEQEKSGVTDKAGEKSAVKNSAKPKTPTAPKVN